MLGIQKSRPSQKEQETQWKESLDGYILQGRGGKAFKKDKVQEKRQIVGKTTPWEKTSRNSSHLED